MASIHREKLPPDHPFAGGRVIFGMKRPQHLNEKSADEKSSTKKGLSKEEMEAFSKQIGQEAREQMGAEPIDDEDKGDPATTDDR